MEKKDRQFAGYYFSADQQSLIQMWLDRPIYEGFVWKIDCYVVGEGWRKIKKEETQGYKVASRVMWESKVEGRSFVWDPFSQAFSSENLNPLLPLKIESLSLLNHLFDNKYLFDAVGIKEKEEGLGFMDNTGTPIISLEEMARYARLVDEFILYVKPPFLRSQYLNYRIRVGSDLFKGGIKKHDPSTNKKE